MRSACRHWSSSLPWSRQLPSEQLNLTNSESAEHGPPSIRKHSRGRSRLKQMRLWLVLCCPQSDALLFTGNTKTFKDVTVQTFLNRPEDPPHQRNTKQWKPKDPHQRDKGGATLTTRTAPAQVYQLVLLCCSFLLFDRCHSGASSMH